MAKLWSKKSLDEVLGIVGVCVAIAVFVGVNYFWPQIVSLLEGLGWSDFGGQVGMKQQKLVAAVLAFCSLVPLLILGAVLKRKQQA